MYLVEFFSIQGLRWLSDCLERVSSADVNKQHCKCTIAIIYDCNMYDVVCSHCLFGYHVQVSLGTRRKMLRLSSYWHLMGFAASYIHRNSTSTSIQEYQYQYRDVAATTPPSGITTSSIVTATTTTIIRHHKTHKGRYS